MLLDHNCLHLTIKPYFSSEADSRKYDKLPNIVFHASKNIKEKQIKNVWPANSALFIYISTHCIETVKKLHNKRY